MPDSPLGQRAHWRMAALEPYTDAPTTTQEWLRALELGADAAVRVVLEHLSERISQVWVSDIGPEGRSDLDQMWNNALLIPRREIEALLQELGRGGLGGTASSPSPAGAVATADEPTLTGSEG